MPDASALFSNAPMTTAALPIARPHRSRPRRTLPPRGHQAIIYHFICDQDYESLDGKFVRQEDYHDYTIGYDDVNQLFWYSKGIVRIVLTDKVRLPLCGPIGVD